MLRRAPTLLALALLTACGKNQAPSTPPALETTREATAYAERIEDAELAEFYRELMISEAGHYTTFLKLARKYGGGIDVDARWQECLEFEADIIQNYGKKETMHG